MSINLGGRFKVGAGATDSRLSANTPSSYAPPGTGPGGPWPTGPQKGNAYTPEASTLVVLTVAEIAIMAVLRKSFRRYHGG